MKQFSISTSTSTKQKLSFVTNFKNQMSKSIFLILFGTVFLFSQGAMAQTVPDTDDTQRRTNSAPQPGWTNVTGSCDCSDANKTGIQNQDWELNGNYPPPIAGHDHFMSCGSWFVGGESAQGTITGLTVGQTYTFSFHVGGFRSATGNLIHKHGDAYRVVVGNDDSGYVAFSSPLGWSAKTFTFTADATSETITVYGASDGAFINNADNRYTSYSFGSDAVSVPCNAGSNSPNLSSTSISNSCPSSTVNLNSITASNTPAGTSLTWHTGTPATDANKIANPSSVGAGTYYAAFYDSSNNCYSGTNGNATSQVTATVTSCCNAGSSRPNLSTSALSNACPATTADLTSVTASNAPGGTLLTWHTGTPATNANKIANPSSVGAGTYYAAFYDSSNNCYSGTTTSGNRTRSLTVTSVACCAAGVDAPKF